jgi:hypothetical protein
MGTALRREDGFVFLSRSRIYFTLIVTRSIYGLAGDVGQATRYVCLKSGHIAVMNDFKCKREKFHV